MPRLNLPSAKRTVTRGVGVCRRMGYKDDQALELIMSVCYAAARYNAGPNDLDLSWLAGIHEEARCRLAELRQPR